MRLPVGARLVLVRHAESEGNAGKIMQGAGEYPLSAQGRKQAAAAAMVVSRWPVSLVVASDLSRAKDTAVLAAGRLDGVDARLRERGAGPWEGRPRAELEAQHPGSLEDDTLRPPGFEPVGDVVARMRAVCVELLDAGAAGRGGHDGRDVHDRDVHDRDVRDGVIVAFTHGAVLRALAGELGEGGGRFGHLEGLCLGDGLVVLGRVGPLHEGSGP